MTWLADHVRRSSPGRVGPRFCRAMRCPDCRRPVISGLDGDRCAFMIKAEPVPLSPLGEALARLGGLQTVRLTRAGGRFLITARDPWHITDRQPLGLGDVLAEHVCGQETPEEARTGSAYALVASNRPEPAECPF